MNVPSILLDLVAESAHERCAGRDAYMVIAEMQRGAYYVCVNAQGDASSAQLGNVGDDVNSVT